MEHPQSKKMGAMDCTTEWVGRITGWVTIIMLAVVFVVLLVAVFFRYVLNNALSWSAEFATFVNIWIVYLGASIALRGKEHVGLEYVVIRLSKRTALWADSGVRIMILAFLYCMIHFGLRYTWDNWTAISPAMEIQLFWVNFAIPVSGILMAFYTVRSITQNLLALFRMSQR
jgi:TRAP-type transport system small permease protein